MKGRRAAPRKPGPAPSAGILEIETETEGLFESVLRGALNQGTTPEAVMIQFLEKILPLYRERNPYIRSNIPPHLTPHLVPGRHP